MRRLSLGHYRTIAMALMLACGPVIWFTDTGVWVEWILLGVSVLASAFYIVHRPVTWADVRRAWREAMARYREN